MPYLTTLPSPVGPLHLASDGEAITGLWIEGQKYFAATLTGETQEAPELPVFRQTAAWLEDYFAGRIPPALPPLAPQGSPFRQAVWQLLLDIPRGQTVTYGALAQALRERGVSAAPQAVGGAVGHNPISILIPCHRVVGTNGSLTGYAGGIAAKQYLLTLEGVDITGLSVSKKDGAVIEQKRLKKLILPKVRHCESPSPCQRTAEPPTPGKYPCPCCGCKTFPVPAADALAYICPVCMWENDVFTTSDDEPSDENRGMTLNQGRAAYKKLEAVREEFLPYARKPLPEELP